MAADGPYIIVDNESAIPLDPKGKTEPIHDAAGRGGPQEPPFGIVDRVSISSEGREKARQYLADSDVEKKEPIKKKLYLLPLFRKRP